MPDLHLCNGPLPTFGPPPGAVTFCQEHKDGTLWVDNDEYASQVFFCPLCGFKARVAPELAWDEYGWNNSRYATIGGVTTPCPFPEECQTEEAWQKKMERRGREARRIKGI